MTPTINQFMAPGGCGSPSPVSTNLWIEIDGTDILAAISSTELS